MKTKNKNLTTLDEFKEKNYGKPRSKKRDELEAGYEAFKRYIRHDIPAGGLTK